MPASPRRRSPRQPPRKLPRKASRDPRRPPSQARLGGPHEWGQNFLVDTAVANRMAGHLADASPDPVVELGAGAGALTEALTRIGRPITAVEVDPGRAGQLRRRFGGRVEVVRADMLAHRHPDGWHDVISNVPFGITTPLLRRLMRLRTWRTAVLLVQWEVARKRSATGRTTMLTACWWPWYAFDLDVRVPSASFRPRPGVDGGILLIRRRAEPLVPAAELPAYQRLVRDAFTGPGQGFAGALANQVPRTVLRRWMGTERLPSSTPPGRLDAGQWARLYALVSGHGARRHPADGSSGASPGRRGGTPIVRRMPTEEA